MAVTRMGKPAFLSQRRASNQRRAASPSFLQSLREANTRAHEQANRRVGRRGERSIFAAVAALPEPAWCEDEGPTLVTRLLRWMAGLFLLPVCGVTLWTFLSRFTQATLHQGFWQTAAFWYFCAGGVLMTAWFFSGLLQRLFLYLYVLGHELTHSVFVVLCRGRVTDFHVSLDGGYITTNKSNLLIALSPYFVPFWSLIAVGIFSALRHTCGLPPYADKVLFGAMGATWAFHVWWTLAMIPREQPDLRENGVFLSLVIIIFANLCVLVALLCLAAPAPWRAFAGFTGEWLRHAQTLALLCWDWLETRLSR